MINEGAIERRPYVYTLTVQGKLCIRIWEQMKTNNLHHNRRGQQKLVRDRKLILFKYINCVIA